MSKWGNNLKYGTFSRFAKRKVDGGLEGYEENSLSNDFYPISTDEIKTRGMCDYNKYQINTELKKFDNFYSPSDE